MAAKPSALNRILGRLDNLDTTNLTILVQRLARERELLETVINSVHDGILVLDDIGVIQYANTASLRIIGLNDEDIGKTVLLDKWPDLARWVDIEHASDAIDEATAITREIEMHYPEQRYVRLVLLPMNFPGDTYSKGYVMVLSDITEDKESTQEMLESERISSIMLLAAGVAHEIGNPLNSLNIHLQLIERKLNKLEKSKESEQIEKSISVCKSEVERLNDILNHFLGAIRQTPPDFHDVDLIPLLEEVLTVQEETFKTQKIDIDVEVSAPLPVIQADANQIKQVLYNILKNAIEAMPRGGKIKIKPQSDDEFVYLLVADTGSGIEPEEISRIFNPYYSTKKDGHGLGMMVVNRIMRAHGANIGIDSKVGKGTVVTLQFPQKHRRIKLLEER